jgi:hypothetical protein
VAGARELLEALTRLEAARAALIGRLSLRADAEWLAELLVDLEEDEIAPSYRRQTVKSVPRGRMSEG